MNKYYKKIGEFVPALKGSSTLVGKNDKVFIQKHWKPPVPTNQEVNLFFQLFNDQDPLKIAFGLLLVTAARPVEIVRTTWTRFDFDKEKQEFSHLIHETYKPTNRVTATGKNVYFKQVKKDIAEKSQWLNELLLRYHETCPQYYNKKLFPFSATDSLNKAFTKLRKKIKNGEMPPEYNVFLERTSELIKGVDSKTNYRISTYSLRRFAITFMYYSKAPIGFDQDIVALSRYIGHSNPQTTFKHYIMPKENIGLTQDMIDQRMQLDQFISLQQACQTQLPTFVERPHLEIIRAGQLTLGFF